MSIQVRVAVVADSAVSLPKPLVEEHQLYVVPIELVFQGKSYRDGRDLETGQFYQMLRQSSSRLPTTSAPQPASFLEAFHLASKAAPSILCLTISSRISSTYDSAKTAVEMAREAVPGVAITLLDTGTAAGGQALVTLEAARTALMGKSIEEVVTAAQRVLSGVRVIAFLDTLYYLWKGGRVPRVAAWASSMLKLKPLLELSRGEVHLLERPRTRDNAVERLVALMAQGVGRGRLHATVMHADHPGAAEALKERIASEFVWEELFVSEFTPVMGAHTGPGLLGIAFWSEQ